MKTHAVRCESSSYDVCASPQEHYDDHCVLVLQLSGRKRWHVRSAAAAGVVLPQLYAPRRPPRPSARAAGEGPHTDDGDTVHYTLDAGDVLYIPRGWPHQATAIQVRGRSLSKNGLTLRG